MKAKAPKSELATLNCLIVPKAPLASYAYSVLFFLLFFVKDLNRFAHLHLLGQIGENGGESECEGVDERGGAP